MFLVNLAGDRLKKDALDQQMIKDYIGVRGLGVYYMNQLVDAGGVETP